MDAHHATVVAAIENGEVDEHLDAVADAEAAGSDRTSVVEAIETRRGELD